ncbi:type I restriction endonuclease subunit R [Umezakia ovalisporum]|uniref:type I restriction endonuclease subunit R n=1 Tax=Umezakia ovalisporum TaxID=75695 RepID=UPI00247605C1|nr:type I restriction endonuclease subunit R [Umezakia ovalisporum]MDH6086198.1 type I restriction endonuclease subunit R [Umezakia ovalisporum TAC611]
MFNEYSQVELPLINQLQLMGWQHIEGDIDAPYLTDRQNFREVLLMERLHKAIGRINLDDNGQPWLDDSRINTAIGVLERLGTAKLMEANQIATDLLLQGTVIEGDPQWDGGRDQTVRFIDFDHPERNDFLIINQFRVDIPGGKNYIIPDIVLFVNGIPLVVIECKSPSSTEPMAEGINQLRRYSNQREEIADDEGVEKLFHYNQFLISTFFHVARVGTIGASYQHYLEWKDTSPVSMAEVAAELGVRAYGHTPLSSQQILVAGMLRPALLLDIVRNFTLFQESGGKNLKIVARYQQFRAVQESIRRLQNGQTRCQHGESDQRGGIIWHTQGSGKSLTMVFLVRKLRTLPKLRRFKVVVVTDRVDLQKQLSNTASLTNETVLKATNTEELKTLLRQSSPDLIFATIQKYQQRDEDISDGRGVLQYAPTGNTTVRKAAEKSSSYNLNPKVLRLVTETEQFPILNDSEDILVLVDEAHRTQASQLHANLMAALRNCARIGFTGTPIVAGKRKRTYEIFGEFIDRYTIQQSEADGATVPILYEGRTAEAEVADGRSLDQLFEDMFRHRTPEELAAIRAKYATEGNVLEAPKLIAAKAEDMLRHYVETVLPNGFKAQVVASSRLAAVRYQQAFVAAHEKLVTQLESFDPSQPSSNPETDFLNRIYPQLEQIKGLKFASIISSGNNDDPAWKQWSDKSKVEDYINRFKKPLVHPDLNKQDSLAFIIVKSMLLTGFDAPIEQVLYLDRSMQGHELLQAIARVNRTYTRKSCGFVVDYYGVARHLKQALAVYSAEDIQGALISLKDELPKLSHRYQRVLAVFQGRGIPDITDVNSCIDLLRDIKIRAEFVVKLKQFLESLDIVMPRPEALPYIKDAKILGYINKAAANLYRDFQLNLYDAGNKVRQLIDEYIIASGIDPQVPPISIMDADFENAVNSRTSNRAKASEMEHAARYHISKKFQEDPSYYKKLSERLEEILEKFQDKWAELVEALRQFTEDLRQGRPADETGLDPNTQAPFLGILVEEINVGAYCNTPLDKLVAVTVEMVEHIRQEIRIVDFWRNAHAQNVLRGWIVSFLDDHDVISFSRQQAVSDRIVELAKHLHARLTT